MKEVETRGAFRAGLDVAVVSPGQLLTLYQQGVSILDPEIYENGSEIRNIAGEEVRVSTQAIAIRIEDRPYEARLAQERGSLTLSYLLTEPGSDPAIALNTDLLKLRGVPDSRPMTRVGRFFGLDPRIEQAVLILEGSDLSDSVNNADDFMVARTITLGIKRATEEAYSENLAAINARRKEKSDRRRQRIVATARAATIGSVATVGLFYHVPDGADAKWGPLPMPSPVEWIVDINNATDHKAQGFAKPASFQAILPDELDINLPVDSDYDVREVPSAYFDPIHSDADEFNVAKPGLYALSLTGEEAEFTEEVIVNQEVREGYRSEVQALLDGCGETGRCMADLVQKVEEINAKSEASCQTVEAEVASGHIGLFTRDETLPAKIDISTSANQIQFCAKPGQSLPGGVIYIYDATVQTP